MMRTPDGHGRLELIKFWRRTDRRQYEDKYRLCYLRGPEGIIVALTQEIG